MAVEQVEVLDDAVDDRAAARVDAEVVDAALEVGDVRLDVPARRHVVARGGCAARRRGIAVRRSRRRDEYDDDDPRDGSCVGGAPLDTTGDRAVLARMYIYIDGATHSGTQLPIADLSPNVLRRYLQPIFLTIE